MDAQKVLLDNEWHNILNERLRVQADIFSGHMIKELGLQRSELQSQFNNDINSLVDYERAGRLGKLDTLALKLAILQKRGIDSSERNERTEDLIKLQALLDQVTRNVKVKKSISKEVGLIISSDGEMKFLFDQLVDQPYLAPNELEFLFENIRLVLTSASLLANTSGPLSYFISSNISPFFVSRTYDSPGSDAKSTIGRCERLISNGDFEGVCREFTNLKGWSRIVVDDWIQGCQGYLQVKQAIDIAEIRIKMRLIGVL